jgi:hypothetical protein
MLLFPALIVALSCGSSQGIRDDLGGATVTESKSDVSGCEHVGRVTATVDLREFEDNRAAAMEALFNRLRNNTLQRRCDTVYLITVEETTTVLQAIGEAYRCEPSGISDGPRGGIP